MKLSIVVPCYNEAKNIPLILQKFDEVVRRPDVEVILVNNGSTDNSEHVLNELLPNYEFARSILVENNQGYGFGIISGLKACSGEFIGWTHADMQTDPGDCIKSLEKIESLPVEVQTNTYVKGDRKGRPAFDQFFTTGMSLFESFYLGEKLWDINAQPNIFPRKFFESWSNPPYDFSLDLYVLYLAKKENLNIIRIPVLFPERIHGESKWNNEGFKSKYKFIKRTLEFSVKLKKQLNETYSS
jgi:glycosyltransferase involved in cell wall biosynthesis